MKKFFLVLLLFQQLFVQAQNELVISDAFTLEVLGKELQVYNDDSGRLSLQEIIHKDFINNEAARPNLGFSKGAYWVRTSVKNISDSRDFNLLINQPLLDTLDIYILNDVDSIISAYTVGESFSKTATPFNTKRNYRIPLIIHEGETQKIYMRIATAEQIVLPVYIATQEGTWNLYTNSNLLFGAYFGIIIVMMLYNFFIFLSVRDRSYLIYVIYVFFVGITQAALEGYTHLYIWPEFSWLASRSVYLFTSLVSISSITFLREFLRTRIYAPRLHKISNLIYIYFITIFIFALIDINPIVHVASQIGIGVVGFYIFATSIVVYRSGYTPAKFYLLAWSILLVGIVIYSLKDSGLIPSNPFTNYMLMVGSAIEVVLLSLALADRINILKKEKAQSQADALRISKENEEMVTLQNVQLEQKVSERTLDLETSNNQLSVTLHNLQETQSQLVDAEKMASLGQLTAGIAHEINNPINFVIANIKPLRYDVKDILDILDKYDGIRTNEEFDSEKEKIEAFKKEVDIEYVKNEIDQLLDGIQDGARRTAEIVGGLKNFSRLDESNLKYVDINEGIESTLVILRGTIPANVRINKELGDLPNVECLPGKINQVFMNIANNALQALSKKDDEIDLFLNIKSWHNGDFVYISFEDNGLGIAEEHKNRIFDPFFTTKDVGEGTGLGLSISFKIIEKHKGQIKVDSEVNNGAKFTIKLPVKSAIDMNDE
ncbi:GHKL domain-containing protein [Cryomorpha ignava]|uniref:histidine kinase n=1 Tax=Cryomorpha ignava TaxID=101383 RepID=A0A7K3WVX6_9FLAO|nr:7TM diverse intracellular signaling domain-containing protein [Cryomorpha ignava]NEN25664.1 GHKL domain-containing protein [Cryomorpha ignava]